MKPVCAKRNLKPILSCLAWAGVLAGAVTLDAAEGGPAWSAVTLASPRDVELSGPLGSALQRGVERLAQEPYTADWLMADVSFQIARIFTNYSGDVSGRFLELAVLTRPRGQLAPPPLSHALATVARYQKPDGHFGADVDLAQPLTKGSAPIPMLWGNARLLVGLVTAARELNDPTLLAAARRLGDFYVNTDGQLCSPQREADYRSSGTYGDGYTCCYFPAMEGLALLGSQLGILCLALWHVIWQALSASGQSLRLVLRLLGSGLCFLGRCIRDALATIGADTAATVQMARQFLRPMLADVQVGAPVGGYSG